MKKVFKLAMVFILVLGIVGCASNTNQNNLSTDPGNSNNLPASESSNTKEAKKISYVTEDGKFEIIESNYYVSTDDTVAVNIRVKNLTDEDYDYVSFEGYAYDSNGDKFNNVGANIWGIDAKSSAYSNAYMSTGVKGDSFGGIKLTGLTISNKKDGTYYREYSLDFEKKMVISKDDMNETDMQGNLK